MTLLAVVGATLSIGCGGDSAPAEAGATDTDSTETADSDGPDDPDDSSAASTGGENGSTGLADDTSGDDTGEDTGDEVADSPYRVVFSSSSGGTVRLYSAAPDFAQVASLTPAGPGNVDLGPSAAPQLHASGKHVAYRRGDTIYAADVWTGQYEPLTASNATVHRLRWSPVEPVLAWTADDYRLRSASVGGSAEVVFDASGDGFPSNQIYFDWGPLGDRLMLYSRPDGAPTNEIWMIDADGSNHDSVCRASTGHCTAPYWMEEGDRIAFVGDVSPEHPGAELAVGERDDFEVISHSSGNVTSLTVSRDRSRVLYVGGASIFSANVDGTGNTLIGSAAANVRLHINDDGTWAAWDFDHDLTVSPTTLHAPTLVAETCVDSRTIRFEPGGARIAYMCGDETATLWRVDGNGPAEVSHALPAGQRVVGYDWAGDGLRYLVRDDDGVVGIFHTATGDTPSFEPEADELELDWVESSDGNLLVVRTERDDESGRLCAFDVSDPSVMSELGCHETNGSHDFVAIAFDRE